MVHKLYCKRLEQKAFMMTAFHYDNLRKRLPAHDVSLAVRATRDWNHVTLSHAQV